MLDANRLWLVGSGSALALASLAFAWSVSGSFEPAVAAVTAVTADPTESPDVPDLVATHEIAPDETALYPIKSVKGTPLPELFPSLAAWAHPVIAAERKLPLLPTGHFGAERSGALLHRCGEGHCGADLDGPRGRPIVAVAGAVVLQIERSRNGKDGRSGRYVRLEHDDGALTSYMHLDSIAPGLEVGDRVDGGQLIGTLGATGVRSAGPHLHFALEVPRVPGTRAGKGIHTNTRYVNPAPFLVRATVHDHADRRRADKPVW